MIAALLICADSAAGRTMQSIEKYRKTCSWAAARAERKHEIPAHLLQAIALAESGRWDKDSQAHFAWPWTVTSGGEGKYYPSKQEAMNAVRRLQNKGVTNIDVGCMQINLHYHGDAFDNLGEAFDPIRNTTYSADFLTRLHKQTGSWMEATGKYHSSTPKHFKRYKAKVAKLWKASIRQDRKAGNQPGTTNPLNLVNTDYYKPAPIDRERTAMLNTRLRDRVASESDFDQTLNDEAALPRPMDQGETVQVADSSFDAFRNSGIEAMKNRLRAEAGRIKERGISVKRQARTYDQKQLTRGFAARDRFKQRRANQLEVWRKRQSLR